MLIVREGELPGAFAQAYTDLHREIGDTPLAEVLRVDYPDARLSRGASKTSRHNLKRAPEPQGSSALDFFVRRWIRSSR